MAHFVIIGVYGLKQACIIPSVNIEVFQKSPIVTCLENQLWICHKQLGQQNVNYLNEGDVIQEGEEKNVDDMFSELSSNLQLLCVMHAPEVFM